MCVTDGNRGPELLTLPTQKPSSFVSRVSVESVRSYVLKRFLYGIHAYSTLPVFSEDGWIAIDADPSLRMRVGYRQGMFSGPFLLANLGLHDRECVSSQNHVVRMVIEKPGTDQFMCLEITPKSVALCYGGDAVRITKVHSIVDDMGKVGSMPAHIVQFVDSCRDCIHDCFPETTILKERLQSPTPY